MDKNRVKVLSIDQQLLVTVFNWWRNPPHCIALPITDELPEDCVVLSVTCSWDRRCIEALVASETFPVCPDGAMPDRIPGMITEFRAVPFTSYVED